MNTVLLVITVDTCALILLIYIPTIRSSFMVCTPRGTNGEQERYMQGLGDETCGKETTWKT
jgi:hypothetical protein